MKPYQNLSLDDMPGEIWKPIPDYEDLYYVSNFGRIKSIARKKHIVDSLGRESERIFSHTRILKQSVINGRRYLSITLCKDGILRRQFVHRLVLLAFVPNTFNKPCADHINTDTYDNRLDNLRWVTHSENSQNELTKAHISKIKSGKNCYFYGKVFGAKSISCTRPDGTVKFYSSIMEASRDGFNYRGIQQCLCGNTKHHHNCKWSYV